MATINHTLSSETSPNIRTVSWEGFAALNDVGDAVEMGFFSDRTVQTVGTFAGSIEITIEGSNDGVNFTVLTDPQGNAIEPTAECIEAIIELPRYIRPRVTVGSGGADVDVHLFMRGTK